MEGSYILVLLILFLIFYFLAKKSEILRDSISDETSFKEEAQKNNIKNPRAPFSLSRTQFAFWTIIIVSSFFYLVISNGFKVPAIDNVNLILLGISMGTSALASTIDSSQQKNARHQNQPSGGFLADILSDSQGVSIHRFQNVIWTLVVGIIYVVYVSSNKLLPGPETITQQLLVLMGISSGTYLGLKIPENSQTENQDTSTNIISSNNIVTTAPDKVNGNKSADEQKLN